MRRPPHHSPCLLRALPPVPLARDAARPALPVAALPAPGPQPPPPVPVPGHPGPRPKCSSRSPLAARAARPARDLCAPSRIPDMAGQGRPRMRARHGRGLAAPRRLRPPALRAPRAPARQARCTAPQRPRVRPWRAQRLAARSTAARGPLAQARAPQQLTRCPRRRRKRPPRPPQQGLPARWRVWRAPPDPRRALSRQARQELGARRMRARCPRTTPACAQPGASVCPAAQPIRRMAAGCRGGGARLKTRACGGATPCCQCLARLSELQ